MANQIEITGTPKSSNEMEQWLAQGRTFDSSTGKWYGPSTTPTAQVTTGTTNTSYLNNLLGIANERGLDVSQILSNPNYVPPKTETPKYDYSAATSSADVLAQQLKDLQTQKDEAAKKMEEAGKTAATDAASLIASYKPPTIDLTGATTTAESKYGTQEALTKMQIQNAKVAALQGELEKLNTEELTAIDAAEGRVASRGAIEGEKDTITRAYNIKKAYKSAELYAEAAVAQVYSNNYAEAQNLVSKAVDAYTTEIKQQIDNYNNLFTIQSDWLQSLDQKEQNLIEMQYNKLLREEEKITKDKTTIGNLMLEYAGAGITLDDTLESALAKAERYTQLHPEISQTLGSAETGYTMYDKYGRAIGSRAGTGTGGLNLTNTQLINGAAIAEMNINDFKSLPIDEQAFYLTGGYEDTLSSLYDITDREGFANASYAINDLNVSEGVKRKLLQKLLSLAESEQANQTSKIFVKGNDISLNTEKGEEKISKTIDLDTAANNLGYGMGIFGFYGNNVAELNRRIAEYVDEERAKFRTDASIYSDIKSYLQDAANGEITDASNPLIRY